MKGGKTFLFTCQRILAAEQKKLKKGNHSLLQLPYVKRNLAKHNAALAKASRAPDVDILEAVQFFYCLITAKPALENAINFLSKYDLVAKVLKIAQEYRAIAFPFGEPRPLDPSGHLPPIVYSILVETSLFLTTVTTLDCDEEATDTKISPATYSTTMPHFEARPRQRGEFDEDIFCSFLDLLRAYRPKGPKEAHSPTFPYICMYSMWALRNVTANPSIDRAFIINQSPLPDIVSLLVYICDNYCSCCESNALVTMEQGVALLKNICTWPSHLFEGVFDAALCQQIIGLVKSCWALFPTNFIILSELFAMLTLLTEINAVTQTLMMNHIVADGEIIPTLVEQLLSKSGDVAVTCARLMGNLVASSQTHPTDLLLDAGCLKPLFLATHPTTPLIFRKEVVWTLSNICAGTELQACRVINYGKDFTGLKILITTMRDDRAFSVRREAAWSLLNLCHLHPKFLHIMIKFGVLAELTHFVYEVLPMWGAAAEKFVSAMLNFFEEFLQLPQTSVSVYPGRPALECDISKLVSFFYLFVEGVREECNEFIEKFFPDCWTKIDELD